VNPSNQNFRHITECSSVAIFASDVSATATGGRGHGLEGGLPSGHWHAGKGPGRVFADANDMYGLLPAGLGGLPGLDRHTAGECGPRSPKSLASDQEEIP